MKHLPIPKGPDGKTAGQRDREACEAIAGQRRIALRIVLALLLAGCVVLGLVAWSAG